ncbi:response regulator transcription factor [Erwinia persicina]|uniref:Response regulator transcription factor n=1 Tax=Erwinia persicina TaxID=55211 RepID=A0ABR8ZU62_9GAMM|nr:response regulator transcription factor [Erwinia persicina]MBD8106807.1 response regulator transcription factor [Erwinia persicina]MBD8209886.1 response regulator transcription factor [Erwinia persicina]
MKILLVDDDLELGTMLSEYLIAEGFDASLVLTGKAGVEGALSGGYSAMILDIMLPDMSGIDVLRQVRQQGRQQGRLPVIMLTAKGDNIDRVIGLEMGADDYMPKPCYPRELVARLRAVLRRVEEQPVVAENNAVVSWGALTLNPATRVSEWQKTPFDLTASEFNLLDLLLRSPDRVVSKDELSEKGLGRPREAYDRSVDVHISNIRQKLAALTHETITIETVRSIGYRIR